jgi:hypothetical protein
MLGKNRDNLGMCGEPLVKVLIGLLLALTVSGAVHASAGAPTFSEAAPMPVPATSHVAALLHDGRVLVVGGEPVDYGLPDRAAQMYDPGTDTWTRMPDMHSARIGHTATVLGSGRVLVVGGLSGHLKPLLTAELFDPKTEEWSMAAPLPRTRFSASASLLPDGRVLVVGGIVDGSISRDTEVYDPTADRWTAGASTIEPHAQQGSTVLRDGSILIAGGYGGGPEIFNPETSTWSRAGVDSFRAHPVLEPLNNGSVLLAAGTTKNGATRRSSKLFDETCDCWKVTDDMRVGRNAAVASPLPGGKVLVAGGGGPDLHMLRSTEIYSPRTGHWTAGPQLITARSAATAVMLASGAVLICGGSRYGAVLDTCEVYSS